MRTKALVTLILSCCFSVIMAQPCLSDWQYRSQIDITSASSLTLHQIEVVVNTADLIANGKARLDGGDIRFSDDTGLLLSFWYDPAEYNTAATSFWVKTSVDAGNDSIYMFYGNATSPNLSSGLATFEFFDNFESGNFAASTWTKCGANTNFSVSGAAANFFSSNTDPKGIVYTNSSFSTNIVAETKVNSVINGQALIGLVDNTFEGYAMVGEGASNLVKMMEVNNGSCPDLVQLFAPNTQPHTPSGDIWSFEWPAATSQRISWGAGQTSYTETNNSAAFTNNKKIILGSSLNLSNSNGTMNVDWVRARKYAASEPVATVGAENEAPVNATATNSGPYCEGEDILLTTQSYAGAVYEWRLGGAVVSNVQNPIITSSTLTDAGIYTLEITMPGGCNASNLNTTVDVSDGSVGGNLSFLPTLCENSNSGTINLTGENGSILNWETASSPGGPWTNLVNTLDSITFQNIDDTAYYRVVVKNGDCPAVYSDTTQVNVDEATIGGFILGNDPGCENNNVGDLNLVYENGNVVQWESSTDGFTWNVITNSSTSQSYLNLATTTYYRAQVKNGVCPVQYSSVAEVTIYDNPTASFSATSVCEGNNTQFTNTSSGTINDYSWNFGNGTGSISQNPSYLYPASGNYNVELTVTSNRGCQNTATNLVQVYGLPNVSINQTDVCLGSPMNFAGVASVPGGTITNYDWDFEDGNTSTAQNPSHVYGASGDYDVVLVTTTNNGCVDSAEVEVTVGAPASVDFLADSVCLGAPIQFINITAATGTVTYVWNFGNGDNSTLTSPSYTYPAPGNYTVTLQGQTSGGTACIASVQKDVVIYENPVADFSFDNECVVDSIVFDNTTTFAGTGPLSHSWSFGDGAFSTDSNTIHLYNSPSNYTVSLTVTSIEGCTDNTNSVVTAYNMPLANFTAGDVCLNTNMQFSNTSTIPSGSLSYQWDFGDLNTSTAINPLHLYGTADTFQVELIAVSNEGCGDTIDKEVIVYPLPSVSFTNTDACDGVVTSFTNLSSITSGANVLFGWDFGDGASSNNQNPDHLFLNAGNYNVQLDVTSNMGCTNSASQTTSVNPLPVADFESTDACIGQDVTFNNTSTILSGSLTYVWDFGDGNSDTQPDPTHQYQAFGFYPVKLIATSAFGCEDSVIKYVETFDLPTVDAGLDTSISQGFDVTLNGFHANSSTYLWSPAESLDDNLSPQPVATPNETTTYELLVTDANGCKNSDSVTVEVIEDFSLFIHNIITPDGNGQNDTWKITNIETFGEAEIYIYDRWGEEVLNVSGYNNDWEGVNGTDQLPDGTYYYLIEFPDSDRHYKGSLTVLRNR